LTVSDDLVAQLLSTTGPIGTLLALGFMWLRGQFAEIRTWRDGIESRLNNVEARQDND
jgi:hypothetical protein